MTILFTSLVEGVLATRVASWLGVVTETVVVVGGDRTGLALAERYERQDRRVRVVESDQELVETARSAGFEVYHGDGTDEATLRQAGAARARRVVAATDDDERNLDVVRVAREAFGVDTVLATLNRADNRSLFEAEGVELLTGNQLDLWALDHLVDQSAPDWLVALARTGGVRTASVTRADVETVADVDGLLADRSFVVALGRDAETWVPAADDAVSPGDRVTVLGRAEAVETSLDRLDGGAGDEEFDASPPVDDAPS